MPQKQAFRMLAAGIALMFAHAGDIAIATEPSGAVAIVSDAVGDAFIVAPRRRGDVPLVVLSELSAGEMLRLEPGCRIVIAFTGSGKVFELEGGGRFLIGDNTVEALDLGGHLRILARDVVIRMVS